MDGPGNFCSSSPATPTPSSPIELPPHVKQRLDDRFSIITGHLDRYWCQHGILKNHILQYQYTPASDSSLDPEPDNRLQGQILIDFYKEGCHCRGQLLVDATTLAPLTPLYPAPFRKLKGIEVGTDEVGRGCLFGPVTAAAVVWPPNLDTEWTRRMIKDSKMLSEAQREEAFQFIIENAISWGVASLGNEVIDAEGMNILKASIKAMHQAVRDTCIDPDHILVDGTQFRFYLDRSSMQVSHTCIPKGDNRYYSIAAASIIAKVTRDRWIVDLATKHPELDERYGIAGNKGYGAKTHMDGIRDYGITKWHRRSFKPCRGRMLQSLQQDGMSG